MVEEKSKNKMSGRQMYDAVTDLVGGPNIRKKDNLRQLIAIIIFTAIGWLGGAIFLKDILLGVGIGLISGWLLSGAFIAVYRLVFQIKKFTK